MGKILITGATGELGQLTLENLLNMPSISKEQVIAFARKQSESLSNSGVEIRLGDYENSQSLDMAFRGVEKLLIISSPNLDNARRLQQNFNVVMAAKNNNIKHIVYVGLADAEKRLFNLEDVDMATEHMIQALAIPYTFMQNPVYLDVLKYDLQMAMKSGRLLSATKGKPFNYVVKRDLAFANAIVLSQDGHQNKIYNLSNHELMTYPEMAEILSSVAGEKFVYEEKIAEEVISEYVSADIDEEAAKQLVYYFQLLIADNHFTNTSNDLYNLLGENISSKKDAVSSLLN